MRRLSSSTALHSAPLLLCDAVRTTLMARFAPARLLLCWNDQPIVVPGFRVRPDGAHAVVRYTQPRVGTREARRTRARAMLGQYRQALLAQGWQADLIDEPRRIPSLRCYRIDVIMSTEE